MGAEPCAGTNKRFAETMCSQQYAAEPHSAVGRFASIGNIIISETPKKSPLRNAHGKKGWLARLPRNCPRRAAGFCWRHPLLRHQRTRLEHGARNRDGPAVKILSFLSILLFANRVQQLNIVPVANDNRLCTRRKSDGRWSALAMVSATVVMMRMVMMRCTVVEVTCVWARTDQRIKLP